MAAKPGQATALPTRPSNPPPSLRGLRLESIDGVWEVWVWEGCGRGHPLLGERVGLAIGSCESVSYGDFTAAVSAGVTPAFDNGWPRLVSGGSQRAGQSGLRLDVSGFAAWGPPLPRNDVREAEPGWLREREPPRGTAAHVQPQPALPSALAPTGSFSPPGGRRWPIGRMRGVNRPSAQHSRLHHSTTAGRTRPVRPHPSPLPRPPGVELIEGRLAGEGIRAAGPPITCDAVSGPRRTRGFGWMTSGCRLEAYSTTGSDGASPSRCGDARAVSPRKSAGGSANRYRACRR